MTPSYLTLEQQLELAKIMEPNHQWLITDYGVTAFGFDKTRTTVKTATRYNPSLTGEDWQQAQALRVIVAAYGLLGFASFQRHKDISIASVFNDDGITLNFCGNDLLTAASRALLGDKT
jgi:hypothetical protein